MKKKPKKPNTTSEVVLTKAMSMSYEEHDRVKVLLSLTLDLGPAKVSTASPE